MVATDSSYPAPVGGFEEEAFGGNIGRSLGTIMEELKEGLRAPKGIGSLQED